MPKSLDDFAIKINLNGWFIRGYATFNAEQVVTGKSIHPRMLAALKAKETFGNAKTPVCELVEGDLAGLEAALNAAGDEAGSVRPATRHEPKPNEGDTPGPHIPKAGTAVIEPKPVEKKEEEKPVVEKPVVEKPVVEESDVEVTKKPFAKKAVKKTK